MKCKKQLACLSSLFNVPRMAVNWPLGKKMPCPTDRSSHRDSHKASVCFTCKTCPTRTSLVAQWLRIRLPVQGTWVQAPVWEDPTCCRAAKPVSHNYWACALEPMSHNYWARVPQLLKPVRLEPMLRNKRSHRNEKPAHHNEEQPLLAATRESPHSQK